MLGIYKGRITFQTKIHFSGEPTSAILFHIVLLSSRAFRKVYTPLWTHVTRGEGGGVDPAGSPRSARRGLALLCGAAVASARMELVGSAICHDRQRRLTRTLGVSLPPRTLYRLLPARATAGSGLSHLLLPLPCRPRRASASRAGQHRRCQASRP